MPSCTLRDLNRLTEPNRSERSFGRITFVSCFLGICVKLHGDLDIDELKAREKKRLELLLGAQACSESGPELTAGFQTDIIFIWSIWPMARSSDDHRSLTY